MDEVPAQGKMSYQLEYLWYHNAGTVARRRGIASFVLLDVSRLRVQFG